MPNHAKESWSRYRQQIVVDAIEEAIRSAVPLGYTGQMVVKVSVEDGRVKVEVETAPAGAGERRVRK
jgi:hypothetical protein